MPSPSTMTRSPGRAFQTNDEGAFRTVPSLDFIRRLSYRRGSRATGSKAWVAQLVEQRIENPRVGGSNPPPGTTPSPQGVRQIPWSAVPASQARRQFAGHTQITNLGSPEMLHCGEVRRHAEDHSPSGKRLRRVQRTIRQGHPLHVMEFQHFCPLTLPHWVAKGSKLLPNKAVRLWTSTRKFKVDRTGNRRSRTTGRTISGRVWRQWSQVQVRECGSGQGTRFQPG